VQGIRPVKPSAQYLLSTSLWLTFAAIGPSAAQSAIQAPPLATATQIVLEGHLSGSPHEWFDAISGKTGTVRPVRTFKTKSGVFCRDFEVRTKGGEVNVGRACRSQGVWIEIKTESPESKG